MRWCRTGLAQAEQLVVGLAQAAADLAAHVHLDQRKLLQVVLAQLQQVIGAEREGLAVGIEMRKTVDISKDEDARKVLFGQKAR